MIDKHCLSLEWLQEKRKGYTKADPSIMEKVIFALYLLQRIKIAGFPFVFKGGTSLLLLLSEPARFSVDIDIIVPQNLKREALEEYLKRVIEADVFSGMTLDEKRSYRGKIPKAHYKFGYKSPYSGKDQEILLDVLFEEHNYPSCVERPIRCEWIRLAADAQIVRTPDVNSIAGDKLTAFAPSTIGVPYNQEKEREIIKQLFDVGMLFPLITDVETFKSSYRNIAAMGLRYRGDKNMGINNVLDDTINTGLILSRGEKQQDGEDERKYAELKEGMSQFSYFVYNGSFRYDAALVAAAKAALLAAIIKTDYKGAIPVFDSTVLVVSYFITDTNFNFLNKKLKNVQKGEALFYWSEVIKLLYPTPSASEPVVV